MNWKSIWKEAAVDSSKYCPAMYLEGLRKITNTLVRIADVPGKILIENFLNHYPQDR
jgi:hypothetical protein